jgi:glycine oxidase
MFVAEPRRHFVGKCSRSGARVTCFDAVIVGQGLAGTALAWRLLDAGWRIAVLDEGAAVTASKVSAGLLTPIMGKNFTRSDDAALAAARIFYRSIEARTGVQFCRDFPAVRVFASSDERARWQVRSEPLLGYLVSPQPDPIIRPDVVRSPFGGFVMHSGQLDTAAYLAASRSALPVSVVHVDPLVNATADGAYLRIGDWVTKHVIFCEGFAAAANPYFPNVSFRSAKGEILLIRLPTSLPPLSVHRRMWMAPTAEPEVFRVGATFGWDVLNHDATPEGRAEIEAELREMLACPYTVLDHMAAVRPILRGSARMGRSPRDARVYMFNGLGTKGAARAPVLADVLARHLVSGVSLPADLDLAAQQL